MKCKSGPNFLWLLVEKSQFWGKKKKKRFYQTTDYYILFLKWRNTKLIASRKFLKRMGKTVGKIIRVISNYLSFQVSPS